MSAVDNLVGGLVVGLTVGALVLSLVELMVISAELRRIRERLERRP